MKSDDDDNSNDDNDDDVPLYMYPWTSPPPRYEPSHSIPLP